MYGIDISVPHVDGSCDGFVVGEADFPGFGFFVVLRPFLLVILTVFLTSIISHNVDECLEVWQFKP